MNYKIRMANYAIIGAAIALFAINAHAADISTERTEFQVEDPVSWNGIYAGAYAGLGAVVNKASFGPIEADGIGGEGYVLGLMFGANFDPGRDWIIGAQVDGGLKELETNLSAPGFNLDASPEYNVDVSARVGYKLRPETIWYLLGGYSYLHQYTVSLTGLSDQTVDYHGWHAGTGIESQFADRWTARVEYRYTQYQGENWNVQGLDIEPSSHVGRIGIARLFGPR